jgi:hypothetical protein
MITADGMTPVEADALLVSSRERRTGLTTWGGRVTPILGASLLPFFRSEAIQVHVGGRSCVVIITSLGEASSEIQGAGPAPF